MSDRRPMKVTLEEFDENYDKIFSKKKLNIIDDEKELEDKKDCKKN